MDLFRVVSFDNLKRVAAQKALAFVSYRKFEDDPHEASLIQALITNDGLKEVLAVLKKHGEHPASLIPLIQAARSADASAYMQCWTKTPEHNLMWERYGDGANAVRMRMTEAGQANLPQWITFHEARYEKEFDICKELQAVTAQPKRGSVSTVLSWQSSPSALMHAGTIDFRSSLTFKLKAYDHENEVRLLTPIFNDFVSPGQKPKNPPWFNSPNGSLDITLVPIGDIKNVVASVMVGPDGSDDLQRDVAEFCENLGIAYEGKSLLKTRRFTGSKKIFKGDPDDHG
jgi:hypothetical protein